MGRSYFIFNGIDCRSMGVVLSGPAPIIRAEERVNHVQIPGIAGDLTEVEGENIYNSYIQTVTMSVHGAFNVRNIYRWLRGAGYVTFSGEPDKKQAARVIGAVTLNRHSYNLDWWEGEVQFYCQPFKEKLRAEETAVSRNDYVRNAGDVDELPEISVSSTGSTLVITAGGNSLTVSDISSGTALIIDSRLQMVLSGNRQTDLTAKSSGEFPVLRPGSNKISGSGWSSATLQRRERFL